MCGITAYIGLKKALLVLLGGLRRLEYRGYDSAGVGLITNEGEMKTVKSRGKVAVLEKQLSDLADESIDSSSLGIAHTRWATHGVPNDVNAHPHTVGDICLVHNGIIENYATLRKGLMEKGYEFVSETDTEVLCCLIADVEKDMGEKGLSFPKALCVALNQVEGTFGIALINKKYPEMLFGARRGSPLILGVGKGEFILASDASAVIEHTSDVVYLEDNDLVILTRGEPRHIRHMEQEVEKAFSMVGVKHIEDPGTDEEEEDEEAAVVPPHLRRMSSGSMSYESATKVVRAVHHLEMTLDSIEKGGYKHFMLKEIMEQPSVLRNCMAGRLNAAEGTVRLGGLEDVMDQLLSAKRIIICACGTSWHAALVGEYLIEKLARVPVEVEYASEFRYRDPVLQSGDVMMVISQSGETADTLAAVRLGKEKKILTLGLVNVVGSTIARETDAGVYLHVGPEIGVASTKAFTGQVCVLSMMAILMADRKGSIDVDTRSRLVKELGCIPDKLAKCLEDRHTVREVSKTFRYAQGFLYLGRGFNFPVALEGALKLKEISYIHAEGYAAAEMKHGPIALIDQFMPVVMVAPKADPLYGKVRSAIEEVRARKGCVIAITDEGNHELDLMCEFVLHVPETEECFFPLLSVVPLQLMSYYIADLRQCSIDQPRNLAKSVTVE